MPKIGLFFGSNTGNTEAVAYDIKSAFDEILPDAVEIHNIGASTAETIIQYDYLIFGVPTWNTGELQDDWDAFMPNFETMSLEGKKLAIFGLGDQNGYGFNFLDAVGILAYAAMYAGAELWGLWPDKDYEYELSLATMKDKNNELGIGDHFLGLGVDQEGQDEKTADRIEAWVRDVKEEFDL